MSSGTAPTRSRHGTEDRGSSSPQPKYYKRGLPKNGGLVFKVIADPQQRLSLLKTGALHVAFEITAKDADSIRSGKSRT